MFRSRKPTCKELLQECSGSAEVGHGRRIFRFEVLLKMKTFSVKRSACASLIGIIMLSAAIITTSAIVISCSGSESEKERKITRTEWTFANVVDSLAFYLEEFYIMPEVGKMMADSLREGLKSGKFEQIKDGDSLLMAVNDLLQRISGDAHLKVSWLDPEETSAVRDGSVSDRELAQWRAENFGFRQLRILDGNIGYLDLREFRDTTYAGKTLVAVSGFLANCEALVIDLRNCRGGRPEMVQLLASYFFSKPTLLSETYDRYDDVSTEMWSLTSVAGTPLYDRHVVLLTGPRTVSAGEGFTSAMMQLGRARVVGERTAGAGHMARMIDFPSLDIRLKLPTGAGVKTQGQQIQGAGILPDILVSGEEALMIAHAEALKAAAGQSDDDLKASRMVWLAEGLIAQSKPINLSSEMLRSYVGQYQGEQDLISVMLDSAGLCAIENNLPAVHLVPFSEHVFTAREYPEDRGKFVFGRDKTKAEKLIILSSDGQSMAFERVAK